MLSSAAVKIQIGDGNILVLPCHRHCDIYEILSLLGYSTIDYKTIDQGFLTERGAFLTRRDAADYALSHNQITQEMYDALPGKNLYSEDLW